MSEDTGSKEVAFDSAAFEEWVEKTAESKDISRGEVLDQMLSSYWILEELTGMMGKGEQSGSTSHLGQNPAGSEVESEDPGASGSRTDVEASGEGGDSTDEKDSSELIREFKQLRSAILELSERPEAAHQQPASPLADDSQVSRSQTPARRTDNRLRRTLSDLQERVETLSEELSEVQSRHDRDVTELQTDIEEALETLGMLESSVEELIGTAELESLAVSLEEELSRIDDTTAELNGRLAQLEEVHSETAGEVTDLADGQSELETRLDREFDSIENLFQHLLDRADELEYRLDAVSSAREEEMEPLEEDAAERDRLTAIMREAHRKNVSTAVCDSCETTVNLELLHEPYCPECDRSITGVESGGWLPFDKPTLETEPIQSASDELGGGGPDGLGGGGPDGLGGGGPDGLGGGGPDPDPSDLIDSPPDDPRT